MKSIESAFASSQSQSIKGHVKIHVGLAEQGKIHAVAEEYEKALTYYRKAIEMTLIGEDTTTTIYTRYYVLCLLEALELNGSYTSVLQYCQRVLSTIEEGTESVEPEQVADVWQRNGVVLLKMGRREEGVASLKKAIEAASKVEAEMPLAQALLFMANSGLTLDLKRISAEQKRLGYFISIRKDRIDLSIAIQLPE